MNSDNTLSKKSMVKLDKMPPLEDVTYNSELDLSVAASFGSAAGKIQFSFGGAPAVEVSGADFSNRLALSLGKIGSEIIALAYLRTYTGAKNSNIALWSNKEGTLTGTLTLTKAAQQNLPYDVT